MAIHKQIHKSKRTRGFEHLPLDVYIGDCKGGNSVSDCSPKGSEGTGAEGSETFFFWRVETSTDPDEEGWGRMWIVPGEDANGAEVLGPEDVAGGIDGPEDVNGAEVTGGAAGGGFLLGIIEEKGGVMGILHAFRRLIDTV